MIFVFQVNSNLQFRVFENENANESIGHLLKCSNILFWLCVGGKLVRRCRYLIRSTEVLKFMTFFNFYEDIRVTSYDFKGVLIGSRVYISFVSGLCIGFYCFYWFL